MKLNLLVIRTADLEALKDQYALLGFDFDCHRHGNGPMHYASESFDFVFEIYPTKGFVNDQLRLGFAVEDLKEKIALLQDSNWKLISEPRPTEWGWVAVLQDLDGRKLELKQLE